MDTSDPKSLWISWFSVSTKNAKAQRTLKSSEAIRLEKKRQIEGKYHTIHPFSNFRSLWDLIMVLNIYTITILESLVLTFEQKAIVATSTEAITNVGLILYAFNTVLFLDIILNFFTGYYDKETKSVRLCVKDIAKKYLAKKFWIHIVFSIPWHTIANVYEYYTGYTQLLHGDYVLRDYFSILSITRILRYGEIEEFLKTYENCSIKYKTFWKMLQLLTYVTTLYHFSACVLLNAFGLTEVDLYRARTRRDSESWIVADQFFSKYRGSLIKKYIRCLFRATNIILLFGIGVEHNGSPIDRDLTIIYRIIGVVHMLYLIGNMALIIGLTHSDAREQQTMTKYITELGRHKKLPQKTIKRMHEYFKFKHDTKFFHETKVVEMLSTQLQKELRLHCSQGLVEEIPMFKCLPKRVLEMVVLRLHTDVFLPGDVIIKSGTAGTAMHFLTIGMVAVKVRGEKDVQIRDGAHFGEKNLITEEEVVRHEEVVAVDPCELEILDKEDFLQVMAPHPKLLKKMKQIYEESG